jgi:hypothetical protein
MFQQCNLHWHSFLAKMFAAVTVVEYVTKVHSYLDYLGQHDAYTRNPIWFASPKVAKVSKATVIIDSMTINVSDVIEKSMFMGIVKYLYLFICKEASKEHAPKKICHRQMDEAELPRTLLLSLRPQ